MEKEAVDEMLYACRVVYPGQQVMDEKLSPVSVRLKPLLDACRRYYHDQPQPFQFISEFKAWQGGRCPLDCISVYRNFGDPASDTAPHWHYIGFGLSDPYGVHKISKWNSSGYGIELTFRLKREPAECEPPSWPVVIMQTVAENVFETNQNFSHGDLLFCDFPFDKTEHSDITDLLFSEDPQLGTVETQFGPVTFLQMVGVYKKELEEAWPGRGERLIDVMKIVKGAGEPWLITDMRRDKTIFELNSFVQEYMNSCYTLMDFVFRGIHWFQGLIDRYKSSSEKGE